MPLSSAHNRPASPPLGAERIDRNTPRRPSGFMCLPSKVARPPSGPLWVCETAATTSAYGAGTVHAPSNRRSPMQASYVDSNGSGDAWATPHEPLCRVVRRATPATLTGVNGRPTRAYAYAKLDSLMNVARAREFNDLIEF
jgi:hypothetical protein